MRTSSPGDSPPANPQPLCDRVLKELDVPHGFGQRGSHTPESTVFVEQVHGTAVVAAEAVGPGPVPRADVVVAGADPGERAALRTAPVGAGIVTADCVPLLISREAGEVVAAIHAGWRGLAEGVIEAGISRVRGGEIPGSLRAAVGPAARGCCYEVDATVSDALGERYSGLIDASILQPSRPGHALLDLSGLATRVLESLGLREHRIGLDQRRCTICSGARFESYRRDGAAAGRLRHFIEPRR